MGPGGGGGGGGAVSPLDARARALVGWEPGVGVGGAQQIHSQLAMGFFLKAGLAKQLLGELFQPSTALADLKQVFDSQALNGGTRGCYYQI